MNKDKPDAAFPAGAVAAIMQAVCDDWHVASRAIAAPKCSSGRREASRRQAGVNGNRQAGALCDLIPLSTPAVNPAGQWNTARLLVKDAHGEHWLNGKKVVEYQIGSPTWDS